MNKMKKFTVAIAIFGLMCVQVGFADEGQNDKKPSEWEIAATKLFLLKFTCPYEDALKYGYGSVTVPCSYEYKLKYGDDCTISYIYDLRKFPEEQTDLYICRDKVYVSSLLGTRGDKLPSEVNAVINQLKENPDIRKNLHNEIVQAAEGVKNSILSLKKEGPDYAKKYLANGYGDEWYDPVVEFEQRCNRCQEIYNELVELAKK